jgi:hypothetical protein
MLVYGKRVPTSRLAARSARVSSGWPVPGMQAGEGTERLDHSPRLPRLCSIGRDLASAWECRDGAPRSTAQVPLFLEEITIATENAREKTPPQWGVFFIPLARLEGTPARVALGPCQTGPLFALLKVGKSTHGSRVLVCLSVLSQRFGDDQDKA